MDNQLHKDLTNMRKLLAHPHSWAQGHSAYTAMGDKVAPWDEAARCWCITGAINYLLHEQPNAGARGSALYWALDHAADANAPDCTEHCRLPQGLDVWNDHPERTHADVIALLDRAIAKVAP